MRVQCTFILNPALAQFFQYFERAIPLLFLEGDKYKCKDDLEYNLIISETHDALYQIIRKEFDNQRGGLFRTYFFKIVSNLH